MPDYKAPLEDIQYLLRDVFPLMPFCQELEGFDDVDEDTCDAILGEAARVCDQLLAPLDASGDAQGARFEDGDVFSPPGFREAYQTFAEGGWVGLGGPEAYGGMGLPKTLVSAVEEMIQGANMAFGLAPMLTVGACLAIQAHGSDELKSRYLPKMYSGEWSGAMDLTEAHAGTDLGLMRTRAEPDADGRYRITGSKIFITWGEHDMAENIVHLVLAKLPDAPAGSRGISLFLVPKFLPDEQGEKGERNTLSCGSIEHKMGIHGSATCVMNFDGATGWLVGEPHKGLACMFTMMNYERLVVGIQGIGVAEASYQGARDYALERVQGRAAGGARNKDASADPIVVHADVRRMLLEMKTLVEGGRAFYLYVAQWLDRARYGSTAEQREEAERRVALLTPVVKAFLTDRAFDACVLGQQVLGGHGYIREWGQEQHVRDARITQIYEGTNGIQAMDLAGRKTRACQGALIAEYLDEIRAALSDTPEDLGYAVSAMKAAIVQLERCTEAIVASDHDDFVGAAAVDYLDMVGYVSLGYMWMKVARVEAERGEAEVPLHRGKRRAAKFYFQKMMPLTESLAQRILAGAEALEIPDEEL